MWAGRGGLEVEKFWETSRPRKSSTSRSKSDCAGESGGPRRLRLLWEGLLTGEAWARPLPGLPLGLAFGRSTACMMRERESGCSSSSEESSPSDALAGGPSPKLGVTGIEELTPGPAMPRCFRRSKESVFLLGPGVDAFLGLADGLRDQNLPFVTVPSGFTAQGMVCWALVRARPSSRLGYERLVE